jgi:hypothetical protein
VDLKIGSTNFLAILELSFRSMLLTVLAVSAAAQHTDMLGWCPDSRQLHSFCCVGTCAAHEWHHTGCASGGCGGLRLHAAAGLSICSNAGVIVQLQVGGM